jgi:hypothetical protein
LHPARGADNVEADEVTGAGLVIAKDRTAVAVGNGVARAEIPFHGLADGERLWAGCNRQFGTLLYICCQYWLSQYRWYTKFCQVVMKR